MAVVKMPELGSASQKFTKNGQSASQEYVQKAAAAANDWHVNTSASETNYERGVQEAIGRKAFARGVANAGPQAYSTAISTSAGSRFSDGISKAGAKWQKGFGQIAAKVQGIDIGPRGITGSPENKQRAAAMADAFRAAKLSA